MITKFNIKKDFQKMKQQSYKNQKVHCAKILFIIFLFKVKIKTNN